MTIRITITTENRAANVKCSNGTDFTVEPNTTGSVAIFDDIHSIEVVEGDTVQPATSDGSEIS